MAPLESAPAKTDCLTSIHYLFLKAFDIQIPLTFVGDMPRLLISTQWSFHLVDASEFKMGDLIFLKRKAEPKLIAHAALALGPDRIFHCKRDQGAVIESVSAVFEIFEQKIKHSQLKYIDPRNKELREANGDKYLRETEP